MSNTSTIIIFLALSGYMNPLVAQSNLYVISATPFEFVTRAPSVKPTVFSLNKSKLDTSFIISNRDSMITTFVSLTPVLNQLIVHQRHITNFHDQTLLLTNLNEDSAIAKFEFRGDEYMISNVDIPLTKSSRELEVVLYLHGKGYFGFSLNNEQRPVFDSDLAKLSFEGKQGIALNNRSGYALFKSETGKFRLDFRSFPGVFEQFYDSAKFNLFPSGGTFGYYHSLMINTDSVTVINGYNSIPHANSLGTVGFIIRPYGGDWYYKEFKGAGSGIRAFGNWLAGYVADYNQGIYYKAKGQPVKYNFNRTLPGKNERRPLFRSPEEEELFQGESENFDQRAASVGYYYPGMLFLFNVITQEYVEWDTGQADSEILLYNDDQVWYRSGDKILYSRLVNLKLSEPIEIVRDDRVRDIHWAFLKR
jgi:hypothetical protein